MSSPSIERMGQALRFHWPEYQLAITLEQFRESSRGGLYADFQASTTAPGYHPHLTQAQLNLNAMRTRAEFAKHLTTLYKEANWVEVMEQVCVLGLREHRQGEPVLRLTDEAQVDPPRARLDPMIYDGLPTVIFGPGGIGKSYLALFCALVVEHGGWHVGLCGLPGPTLYLDYESELGDLVERAQRLRRGHPELNPAQPSYRRSFLPIADDLPALHRIVAESQIKLLVIDSLAAACGADLLSPETAIRFFTALRSLRVASLTLAHVAKNAENKSIYGSVFFFNFARSVWEMQKVQEAGDNITRIGLYHRKCNLGPLRRPIGFKMHFAPDVSLEPLDITEEPDLAEALSLKDRLKAALSQGAKTAKQLAEEVDAKLPQVKARLSEGREKWSIKLGDEQWGLFSVQR